MVLECFRLLRVILMYNASDTAVSVGVLVGLRDAISSRSVLAFDSFSSISPAVIACGVGPESVSRLSVSSLKLLELLLIMSSSGIGSVHPQPLE